MPLTRVIRSSLWASTTTRDCITRRTAEGKTAREIKRCLARYVDRDLYLLLENGAAAA